MIAAAGVRTGTPTGARHHRRSTRPTTTATPTVLEVDGVTARAADGTTLLEDVTFSLQRGWLVAVVGPTGAGKTSLANVLSGMAGLEHGTIHLEGVDLAEADAETRRRIAYVPQDDVLHAQLDLRRTLNYAAHLRARQGARGALGGGRVDAVLDELGLQGCAHLPISVLSGGQRKRANVAVELVGDPEVLVLDEPTAGLDPGFEKSVFATLRQLADRGRTIVVVTHSVRSLPACDRVLFLAPGGRVAFFGPPAEAVRYFAHADPADVFLALHDQPGRSWQQRFRSHPAYARYVGGPGASPAHGRATIRRLARPVGARRTPGRPSQLVTLLRRHLDLMRADLRNLTMLALAGPLLGLLLWAVLVPGGLRPPGAPRLLGPAPPDPRTVAMFLAVSATWLGAANAIREIVKERQILRREHRAGMSLGVYVASKFIALGAVTVSQAVFLTIVASSRQGPPAAGAVLGSGTAEIVLAAALAAVAAVGLGLLLSALVGSPEKAMTILPFVLVTQLIFAGPWSAVSSTPGLRELRALTGAHWGGQAVQATVTGDSAAWWTAIAALVALTVGALVVTHALLGHRNRHARVAHAPTLVARCRRRARTTTPFPRPAWALGVSALVLLSGIGAITVERDQGTGAETASALVAPAALPTVAPPPAAPAAPAKADAPTTPVEGAAMEPAPAAPVPEPTAETEPIIVEEEVEVDPTSVGDLGGDVLASPMPSLPPAPAVELPASPAAAVAPSTATVPTTMPVAVATASPWSEFAQWMVSWWVPLAIASSGT